MARMTKSQAIRIVSECAVKYKKELVNRKLLFLYPDKHKRVCAIEFTFEANNYLHLTGLRLNNRPRGGNSRRKMSANEFYDACLNNKLSESDFELAPNGTSQLKLEVLPQVITKNLSAKMIGDYNGMGINLYTEKLVGSTKACMGFVRAEESDRYIPNTVLKENVSNRVNKGARVIAVYRKHKNEPCYSELTYTAKDVKWDELTFPAQYAYLPKPEPASV